MPTAGPERSLIVTTAGHVDHGKTALVKQLGGVDTDTLREEKARGLTINLGYAYHHFSVDDGVTKTSATIGFVDVPGHTDFINNMLAGAGSMEFALLVVAADDGVMPQTREHLAILDLLGIGRGAVAVTKIDRCEPRRIDAAIGEITRLIEGTTLEGAPLFPVSNQTGAGIEALLEHLHQAVFAPAQRDAEPAERNFRFLIDRAFSVKGAGTVVTGSVRAGACCIGDTVLHTGSGRTTRIRGLRLDTQDMESVAAGQRAALRIPVEQGRFKRGDWLIDPAIHHPATRLDVTLRWIEADFKLSNAPCHLHLGASHQLVTVRALGEPGTRFFQIKCRSPVYTHAGDRFIIRDPASERTIGGGKVVDIFVPSRKRASRERFLELAALDEDSSTALATLLQQQNGGVALERFRINCNLSETALAAHVAGLSSQSCAWVELNVDKRADSGGRVLLHKCFFDNCENRIKLWLADFHRSEAHRQGVSEPTLKQGIDFQNSRFLFHGIVDHLVGQGCIARTGTLLHLPDHEAVLSVEEKDFLARVRPLLLKAGNVPPRTRELAGMTGMALPKLERILRTATKSGSLIQVAANRHYLPETILALADFTEQLAGNGKGFSVIQFRDASGIGRNLCIEILEYFDRAGFTRRDGNNRFLRTGKENVFGA